MQGTGHNKFMREEGRKHTVIVLPDVGEGLRGLDYRYSVEQRDRIGPGPLSFSENDKASRPSLGAELVSQHQYLLGHLRASHNPILLSLCGQLGNKM